MAKSKKRKRLEESGLLDPTAKLSKEQSAALDVLTPEEIETLVSVRNKLKNAFYQPVDILAEGHRNSHKILTLTKK